MSVRDLIGKRWAVPCNPPETFDCWQLVCHVRALHGLQTPSVVERGSRVPSSREFIKTPPTGWIRKDRAEPMHVARIGDKHVGVMLTPVDVLHCEMGQGVCIARLHTFPQVSFWDYRP